MKIMLRYLKPFALVVLICLGLLYGQAMADLALPNLMSDIVNVGIQQGGIADKVPTAIRENGLALVKTFMNEDDKAVMDQDYTLVEVGSQEAQDYVKQFPLLEKENLYILRDLDEEKRAEAEDIFGKGSLAFLYFMRDQMANDATANDATAEKSTGAVSFDMKSGISSVDINALYQMLPMFALMPPESFDKAMDDASAADLMYREQLGGTLTRLFYEETGVDLDAAQNNYIYNVGFKMLAVSLAGVAATIIVGFLSARMGATIARRMRHDLFEKVNGFSTGEFDRFSTASLITRTTNDVQQVQMLIVMGIRMMLYSPIMGIGGVVMAVRKSVSLSWIIVAAVLFLLGLLLVVVTVAMPKFKILQKLIDRLNLVSRENLSGLMVIRAFGNEAYEEKRFDAANNDLANTTRFVQRLMATMMPAMMLIMNITTLTIVWVGSHAIAESTLQIGDMMAFMQYAMQIIMSFLMMAMMFIMVPRASVSATRISEVLSCTAKITDKPNVRSLGNIKGNIEFKDVSFTYDNAADSVLHGISFTAKPGQTTAFIGSTGSGKTTLINLIPRFYDVTEGHIEIDGIDVRDVSQQELRDKIGYIPQKGVLFSGDIRSNILYGKENADQTEIAQAIEIAQAKDFVDNTDNGVESSIAQDGTNVSGGQKQRLSIARALIKRPPIYIFDDSFSALDFKTDAALRKALKAFTSDSTVLIVAQRVSTIMSAEQIIVLDEGRIVGMGTHNELLKSCEAYREIAESQLSGANLQEA